jgi:hypothetical protein
MESTRAKMQPDVASFSGSGKNLSNEPGAIALSCAKAAVCTGKSCGRVEAQKKGKTHETFGAE